MNMLSLFTSFRGRIGRGQYLIGWLSIIFLNIIIVVSLRAALTTDNAKAIIGLPALAVLYFHCAIATKRAHDLGKSGWWVVGWTVASFGSIFVSLFGVAAMFASAGLGVILMLGSALLSLGSFYNLVIKLMFFGGEMRANDYGPPPGPGSGGGADEFEVDSADADAKIAAMIARQKQAAALSASTAQIAAYEIRGANARPATFGKRNARAA